MGCGRAALESAQLALTGWPGGPYGEGPLLSSLSALACGRARSTGPHTRTECPCALAGRAGLPYSGFSFAVPVAKGTGGAPARPLLTPSPFLSKAPLPLTSLGFDL